MLQIKVKNYLDKLDREAKPLESFHGEHDIAKEIKNILAEDKDYKSTKEDMAEQISFDFMEDYLNDTSGWGTYHGPMFVLPNDKGQMVEYPSIKRIDQEILNYWSKRANETTNPTLTSRYAGLVVDFSPKVVNQNADITLFRFAIDSNITICEKILAE